MAAEPMREPTSSAEARKAEAFLKRGAAVSIKEVKRFRSAGPLRPAIGRAATTVFPITREKLLGGLGQDDRVLLSLDVIALESGDDFFVNVFLNQEGATAASATEDSGFAGGFAFFCDSTGRGKGHIFCPIPGKSVLHYRIDATAALRKVRNAGERLQATLVLVPLEGREPKTRSMTVDAASLDIVRATVEG